MIDKNMIKMINNLKNYIDGLFENDIFNTIFVIFVSVFAAHFAPRLPKKILYLFNNNIFKIIFISFIAYSATKNMKIALISSIAFILIIQSLNFIETKNKIIDKIQESTQVVSNNRIQIINKMIENSNVDKKEKFKLIDNVMNSIASDKHKFNTAISYIDSLPAPTPESQLKIIKKLYSNDTNIKNENIINMSNRLLLNNKICKKNIGKIVELILHSKIDSTDKENIFNNILKKKINSKIKIIIIKKMNNLGLSNIDNKQDQKESSQDNNEDNTDNKDIIIGIENKDYAEY